MNFRGKFRELAVCFFLVAADAFGQGIPPIAKAEEETPQKPAIIISDGSRIDLAEKGFSIVPPAGWEIHRDYPNSSLLLQIPHGPGIGYQRTIQVTSAKGPVAIDEATAARYEELLIKNFSRSNASIQDYRIRNFVLLDLPGQNNVPAKGILFYAEFVLEGRPLMQVHILVSSGTRHYLLTYTDLAEHFEAGSDSPYLNTAWQSMTSIGLDSQAPGRFTVPVTIFSVIGGVILLMVLAALVRYSTATSRYRKLAGQLNDEVETSHTHSDQGRSRRSKWKLAPKMGLAVEDMDEEVEDASEDDEDIDDAEWNIKKNPKNNKVI